MKKLVFVLMFALIILSTNVLANEIWQYNTDVEINDETQYANYDTSIILVNYTDNLFTLTIPGSPYDVSLESTTPCTKETSALGAKIVCNVWTLDRVDINVKYTIENKIEQKDGYFIFSDFVVVPIDVKTLNLDVKLPEGMGLIRNQQAFSPENASIGSDGRKSFIHWRQESVNARDNFEFSIAYENIGVLDYSVISNILFVLITIVVLGIVFMKYFSKKKEIKIILPVLKEDEKRVFEALIKHDPGVSQKIIVKDSGYSKAKVSKVLKNLQERGLITLERIGRKNKVYYDKKFKTAEQEDSGNN